MENASQRQRSEKSPLATEPEDGVEMKAYMEICRKRSSRGVWLLPMLDG
jgi:hypothetical protein